MKLCQAQLEEPICSLWELCRITESRHTGCLVLDPERHMLLVGPLALSLLERGGLSIREDFSLCTENPDQNLALHRALDEAGLRRTARIRVALERTAWVSPLIVTISSVRLQGGAVNPTFAEPKWAALAVVPGSISGDRHAKLHRNGSSGAGYALWLRDPQWFDAVSAEELMDVFGLTRRESELTLHLASGGDLAQFARLHGVSMNTVKSHLKQAFLKIGVKTQAQLITNVHCLLH